LTIQSKVEIRFTAVRYTSRQKTGYNGMHKTVT